MKRYTCYLPSSQTVKISDFKILGNNKDNFTFGGDAAKCSSLSQKLSLDNSSQKVLKSR